MTKDEYTEVRDGFARALQALREVEIEFVETALSVVAADDFEDVGSALGDNDAWLTRTEFYGVQAAITLMEQLVGRAHARSV